MKDAGFIGQIEKHEARIKKYTTISRIATAIKILLILTTSSFFGLSVYKILSGNAVAKLIIACLMAGASLVALCLYQDKTREKIKHSKDMIKVIGKHSDRITNIETDDSLLHQYFTNDESVKQQTVVTKMNRDTGFSNYYANTVLKDSPGGYKRTPADEPVNDDVFAKSAAIKFLLM